MSVEPTEEENKIANEIARDEFDLSPLELENLISKALASQRQQYEKRIDELESSLGNHITQKNQHYEEVMRCHKEITDIEIERVNKYANAERLIEWINDLKKKYAIHAFTEGPERQIAYTIERKIAELEKEVGEKDRDETERENIKLGRRIAELELWLKKATANRCDNCGTCLVDKCLRCGAPQCCPRCCSISHLKEKIQSLREAGDARPR